VTATSKLDVKGLNCPMPIVQVKKTIKGLAPGDTLEVETTDPGSITDFPAFCRSTGNTLLESEEVDGFFRFIIQKA